MKGMPSMWGGWGSIVGVRERGKGGETSPEHQSGAARVDIEYEIVMDGNGALLP